MTFGALATKYRCRPRGAMAREIVCSTPSALRQIYEPSATPSIESLPKQCDRPKRLDRCCNESAP
jgi:hypothetical protein